MGDAVSRLLGDPMDSFNDNMARRHSSGVSKRAPTPRICMLSSRNFLRMTYRSGLYEAQDVLLETDEVDLINLEGDRRFQFKEFWLRWLSYHDITKKLIYLNPGIKRVRLNRKYELFVAVCQNYWDILHLNAIDGLKDHCKTSVCWIDELWLDSMPELECFFHLLTQFDHVFIGSSGSVAKLSNAANRPCHWLPPGVDTLRFSPYPNPPSRVIDVYSIGRRWEGIHQSLLSATENGELFYLHDTFPAATAETYDFRQHRDLFANIAKRSRYFLVAPGKFDSFEPKGQVEIGHRYYEGAASGAVMIGQPPNCESFRETFPWPDAVIPVQCDGSDILDVLDRLESEPERLSVISRRNAAEALLRHDWVYRWKEIFRVAGIEPSPSMAARERKLKYLADLAAVPA